MATTSQPYRCTVLPNGYVRVDDRASGLVGLFERDGTPRHGDLTRSRDRARISALVRALAD